MTLGEIHALYLAGTPIESPWEGDDAFEGVVEGDEFDYDWRRIELPLDVVGYTIDLSLGPNPGCEEVDEEERFEWIRAWGRESGGLANALLARPPAVVIDDRKGIMIDGRHRLALASQAGMTSVPVIVGMPPDFSPEADIHFPCHDIPNRSVPIVPRWS